MSTRETGSGVGGSSEEWATWCTNVVDKRMRQSSLRPGLYVAHHHSALSFGGGRPMCNHAAPLRLASSGGHENQGDTRRNMKIDRQ